MKEETAIELIKKVGPEERGRIASIIELFLIGNGYRPLSDALYEVTKDWK